MAGNESESEESPRENESRSLRRGQRGHDGAEEATPTRHDALSRHAHEVLLASSQSVQSRAHTRRRRHRCPAVLAHSQFSRYGIPLRPFNVYLTGRRRTKRGTKPPGRALVCGQAPAPAYYSEPLSAPQTAPPPYTRIHPAGDVRPTSLSGQAAGTRSRTK
ncbi:hypothetical protein OH76DRAFT_1491201 [Lentinus brumalis]|uniref:Uncharacterized protein n=1 Tax=Lentinus brumalis TaxID=2498619 RepID=A0A371CGK2_9APHY|nr:hypothetical protein OH76DRAFT_1491201 [Polyporus brumalis]